MKTFIYSIIAALSCFVILTTTIKPFTVSGKPLDKVIKLDSAQLQQVAQGLPINITVPAVQSDPTPPEIIKYILSILGGIITAIILKLLHHYWPNLFPSATVRDYKE